MKMRKMLGLVLAVCLLVSMVSVISSGTASAEVFDQNGEVIEGIEGVKHESVYYNFDQEGGLLYGAGASVEDMVYLPNGDENGGGCYQMFAEPATATPTSRKNFGFQIGSSSSATVIDTDAYTIYSGVKYKISYKIKFLSSYTYNDTEYTSRSTGSFAMRMVFGYSISSGSRTAKTGKASVNSANLVKYDGYNEIQAGTEEWRTVEHELDLTDVTENLKRDLNGQYKGVLMFQTSSTVGSYLIDDIKIVPQIKEVTQYTYDFVNSETGETNGYKADGTIENVDDKCTFYYGNNPEDGVYSLGVWHTSFPADNTVDENGNITKFAFEAANRTPVKDGDVDSGEKIKLYGSKAKDYLVTVKFKINSLGENSFVRFGIGTSKGSWEGDVTALKYKDYTQVSGDSFEYLTVIITDSMISQLLKDAESTTGYTYLYLIGATEKNGYESSATVLVYETTVTTLDRSVNNKNIIAHLNEDESVEKVELVAYGERNQFGEYITYTSFDGEAIDKVTSSALVKKDSKVDDAAGNAITFDEGYATSNHYKNTDAILSVVEDEEKGSVLQLTATTDYNSPYRFSLQKIKFAKNEGKKYYITFEAKASAAKTMCIILSSNTKGSTGS